MDGSHLNPRAAEKQKVKEMLRDAIRILCQNTVSHHTKLSVEALVGITIDDGEDSFFVSINETVSIAKADHTEAQYQNMEADYNSQEFPASDDNQCNSIMSYNQQYNPSLPYQTVVKEETSVMSYNTKHCNDYPPNNMPLNQTSYQYVAPGESYSGYETADYGYQGIFGVPQGQKVRTSRPHRGRVRGQGVQRAPRQKMTGARNMPVPKAELGGEMEAIAADDSMCSGVDSSEVSHVTLYTCQRCGKQLNRYSSFLRHKKSHLGIVYRCDGCGKILSRKDHLTAHRRNCQAAQQLAALD